MKLVSRLVSVVIMGTALTGCLVPGTNTNIQFSSTSGVMSATNPPVVAAAGVANADYQTCYTATPTDPVGLSTCLNTKAVNGAVFTSTQINTCFTNGNTTALYLAICLSKNGQVVLDHRAPKQFDIDACNNLVGESKIAACLIKHGSGVGLATSEITQAQIDQCNTAAGEAGIEKCLHKNGFIATNASVMQGDSTLCEKVTGGTSGIAACLYAANLIPATVTQAEVDTCVTNVTDAKVVRCLRANYDIPNVLMQYHLAYCNTAVGSTAIATCLDNSGVLPMDPSSTDTDVQTATYLQNDINACFTANAGIAGVAGCLRKRGIITNQVMQQHIDSCFAAAGMNAYNCLAANFAVLPTTLTSAALQACFTKNGGTSANAAACLASTKILPTAPQQVHINECAKFAGIDADTTGTKPGQVGIAACLNSTGLLPTPLTQADIDTCVTAVGLPNVAACLNTKGFVPSYAMMLSPTGIFGNTGVGGAACVTCHNATTTDGNLNISLYSSVLGKATPGDSANSDLFKEVNNGDMPRVVGTPGTKGTMLSAAFIADIALWINQGLNDDVDVPAVLPALLTTGTEMGTLTAGGGLAAAFNGTTASTSATSALSPVAGGTIGKTFATPTTVTRWWIWGSTDLCYNNPVVNGATTLELQASDDNVTYTTIDSVATTATCAGPEAFNRALPGPNQAHLYWRVTQPAGAKGPLTVGELEFFGY